MKAWHLTPKRNRLAIRRWGLKPLMKVYDHSQAPHRRDDVVYFFVHPQGVEYWKYVWEYRALDSHLDVWEIDLSGLENLVEDDPYRSLVDPWHALYYAGCIARVIEPARLRLKETMSIKELAL